MGSQTKQKNVWELADAFAKGSPIEFVGDRSLVRRHKIERTTQRTVEDACPYRI